MSFLRSHQGGGVLLIMVAAMAFALLDTATKYSTQFVPVLMLLWFRYAFQAVVTFALRYPVQKPHLFPTPNPTCPLFSGLRDR